MYRLRRLRFGLGAVVPRPTARRTASRHRGRERRGALAVDAALLGRAWPTEANHVAACRARSTVLSDQAAGALPAAPSTHPAAATAAAAAAAALAV